MAKMKWDINGKGQGAATGEGNNYSGPNLPKGSWTAKIKRMEVTKITSNTENKGKPRLRILLEVTGMTGDKAKYNGHPIWDGLNIIPSSIPFVNGFLHALTDGSERQKRAIESAFWDEDKGPDFRRVKVEKGKNAGNTETHIIKIGKVQINSPKGETLVQVTTKPGEYKGDFKAEVTGYIPFDGKVVSDYNGADGDSDDDEDVDDGLGTEDEDDDDDDIDADDDGDEDDEDDDDSDDEDDDEDEDDDDDDEDSDDEDSEPVAAGRRNKPF